MRATKPATIQPNIYENGSLEYSWCHAKPHGPDSSNEEETRLADTKLRLSSTSACTLHNECGLPFWRWWYRSAGWQLALTWPKLLRHSLFLQKKSPLNKCPSEASPKVGGWVQPSLSSSPETTPHVGRLLPSTLPRRPINHAERRGFGLTRGHPFARMGSLGVCATRLSLAPAASLLLLLLLPPVLPSSCSALCLSLSDFSQPLDLSHWLGSLTGFISLCLSKTSRLLSKLSLADDRHLATLSLPPDSFFSLIPLPFLPPPPAKLFPTRCWLFFFFFSFGGVQHLN